MHSLIRMIVYADTKEQALEIAKENGLKLCERNYFDSYSCFDNDFAISRWGKMIPVVKADSKIGKKLIKEGMKYTKNKLMEHLKFIRELLNKYSDEEIIEQEVTDVRKKILAGLSDEGMKKEQSELLMVTYNFNCFGQYSGGGIFVYDADAEGIRTQAELRKVLECYNRSKKIVWVVPMDTHF